MELLLKILMTAAATAEAAARAREVYETARAQAARDHELTPEQSAQLDAEAEKVFASPASRPSGR